MYTSFTSVNCLIVELLEKDLCGMTSSFRPYLHWSQIWGQFQLVNSNSSQLHLVNLNTNSTSKVNDSNSKCINSNSVFTDSFF